MDNMQIGPAGGNGGKPFDHYNVPNGARLSAVHVYSEWVINALQFEFADDAPGSRPPIGGLGGNHQIFQLDDDEYLTGISGRAGWYVDSLRFHTNKRVSALYGGRGGDREFAFEAPPGYEVGGLFGRADWYLDALGVTVRRRVEHPAGGAAEPSEAEADSADELDSADEVESWMELAGEGEPVAASVVVRRGVIGSQEELDALEEAALAEAIASMEGGEGDEGTVDAAVYTQVLDDASGQAVAVVMAVAAEAAVAEAGGGIESVGDEPNEVAVMVTDAIESEDDVAILEEEAVEGAIDTLLAEDEDADEVEVTIYSGVTDDEASGQAHAAVVAIAVKVLSPAPDASRGGMIEEGETRREPRPKDLELIEGIGPKIAALLIEHGIYDLADLAQAPVEQLRHILAGAGRRFRLADPASWPEQAALGAAGAWDRLSAFQTRLKAGRAR